MNVSRTLEVEQAMVVCREGIVSLQGMSKSGMKTLPWSQSVPAVFGKRLMFNARCTQPRNQRSEVHPFDVLGGRL